MVKLAHVFNRLQPKKVLVAGDFMLDRYTFGKSRRISPEAPVPVVHVESEEERAGGAGNVVLNLISLGMEVRALGRVGKDTAGRSLVESLQSEGVDTKWIVTQDRFCTPQKTRVIASGQQIVRIDHENPAPLHSEQEQKILQEIAEILEGIDLVAISDYAKGFLTEPLLQALIRKARSKNIPVIADPKGKDFAKYAGSTVLKPNLSEAIAASRLSGDSLHDAAAEIFKQVNVDFLMVTRSEAGISIFHPNGKQEDHPVQAREVRDVAGAGDTVLAMLSCAMANGLHIGDATQLANIAATVAVERVGCARVTLSEVARRLIELHAGSKIFAEEHISALEQALKGQKFVLLELDSSCQLSSSLLRSIRTLAENSPQELVICISGQGADEELVSVLASLKDVNYILLKTSQEGASIPGVVPSEQFLYSDDGLKQACIN